MAVPIKFVLLGSILLVCPPWIPGQKNLTAESRENVTLTCRAPNGTITVVEWSRADQDPKYMFVLRNQKYDPDNQHESFKNRVHLQDRQMKDGDVSVILKNVTTNDTGTYECRVQTEGDSMKLIIIIYLSVAAPPGQPGGSTEDGGKKVGVSRGHYGAAAAGLLLLAVVVVAAVISKKQKKELPHPPDEEAKKELV